MKPNLQNLLASLAEADTRLKTTRFVAPRVRGGAVRARVAGLVHTFEVEPRGFQGWGVFQPRDLRTASVVGEAPLDLIERYLGLLRGLAMILVERCAPGVWLAVAANASDAAQKRLPSHPVLVRLVDRLRPFDRVRVRFDGQSAWFERLDRRADPSLADCLRAAQRDGVRPEALRVPHLSPEYVFAFSMAIERQRIADERRNERSGTRRLEAALKTGGGHLLDAEDTGDTWRVNWATGNGNRFLSTVLKRDLTVVSSGICLSGEDEKFDLHSLVGVIEQMDDE